MGKPWLAGTSSDASNDFEGVKWSPLRIILCSSSSPAHRVGKHGNALLGTVRVRGSHTVASLAERGTGEGEGDNDGQVEVDKR